MQQWLSVQRTKQLTLTQLRQAFASSSVAPLLQAGNCLLEERLASCFGSYLLEYNPPGQPVRATTLRYHIRLGEGSEGHQLQCDEGYWPVQPGGADVVVLRHALEFAQAPHDLLREAVQALRPGGHLLLTGVNPYSLYAMTRYWGNSPWRRGRRFSAARIAEWLAVLGLSCEPARYARLPWASWKTLELQESGSAGRSALHPAHACYLLVARRQMHGLSEQRNRQPILPGLMPRPVARESNQGTIFKQQDQHD